MMKTWTDAVCAELDLPADVNVDVILDVARVAAQRRAPGRAGHHLPARLRRRGRDGRERGCRQDPGARGDVGDVSRVGSWGFHGGGAGGPPTATAVGGYEWLSG